MASNEYIASSGAVVAVCDSTERRGERPYLSMYARERIQQLLSGGTKCVEVVAALRQEGIYTCRQDCST